MKYLIKQRAPNGYPTAGGPCVKIGGEQCCLTTSGCLPKMTREAGECRWDYSCTKTKSSPGSIDVRPPHSMPFNRLRSNHFRTAITKRDGSKPSGWWRVEDQRYRGTWASSKEEPGRRLQSVFFVTCRACRARQPSSVGNPQTEGRCGCDGSGSNIQGRINPNRW